MINVKIEWKIGKGKKELIKIYSWDNKYLIISLIKKEQKYRKRNNRANGKNTKHRQYHKLMLLGKNMYKKKLVSYSTKFQLMIRKD